MKALAAFSIAVAAIGFSGLRAETVATPAAIASNAAGTVMPVVADVMRDTPTGAGDPDTIVCRAPQHMASGQPGPQVCRQNSEWWKLAMSGKDLAPDGRTQVDRPTVANPTGEGDPDAVTCRAPKSLARVCQTNRFWANLIKNHQTTDLVKNSQMVDADGTVVTAPRNHDYGTLYGPGGNNGNYNSNSAAHGLSGDSGYAWQSSGRPP